jgi:hypothetical protein
MKQKRKYPARAANVPVTQRMLYAVRDELKSDIKASDFKSEGKFNLLNANIQQLKSEVHRIAILVEEQNAKNNIVLDGLTNLFERQERLESR